MLEITEEKTKPSSKGKQFHRLVNRDKYPDSTLWAFDIALDYLNQERNDPSFDYSPKTFNEWLQKKYNECLETTRKDYWLDSGKLMDGTNVGQFSDQAVLERLVQYAPTNLLDGIWLTNVLFAGPCTEVEAILFQIRMDEVGKGKFEQNHANLYDQLLTSRNIKLPPVTSLEFSDDQRFIESAFNDSVFQMSVGLFPRHFLPELLGMTLFMEWTATPASYQLAKCLKRRNIDNKYYTVHAQVDNIKSGHGFLAKKSVKLYLEQIWDTEGEDIMQAHWRRIWNAYHTWENIILRFESDLQTHLMVFDDKSL